MSSDDTEKIFEVISHRIRRAIIESIAEKGPRSFTELMDDADVRDTGTMTFHLRKMAGFIRKNEKGLYELTDLGRKAYNAIKMIRGEEATSREPSKPGEAVEAVAKTGKGNDLVILGDALRLIIDRGLLESIRSRGKRLLVKDALRVEVAEDIDPDLFNEVVEEISNVISLTVPEKLRSIVQAKARNVVSIKTGASRIASAEMVSQVIEAVSSTISSIVPSILNAVTSSISRSISKDQTLIYREKYQGVNSVHLDLSGARIEIKDGEGSEAEVSIYGDNRCDYDVSMRSNTLKISASGCSVTVKTPSKVLDELFLDSSGAQISIEIQHGVKRFRGSFSGGLVNTRIDGLRDSELSIDVAGGKIDIDLGYTAFEGKSKVSIDLSGGILDLEARVPSGVGVIYRLDKVGGWARVDIDRELMVQQNPKGIVDTEIELSGGLASIKFRRVT
ncbi:MAG: helix-turn-helix domain-containing protein [Sulfolobales archaeon]